MIEVLLCFAWINYKYPGVCMSFSDSCVLGVTEYACYMFFKIIEDEILNSVLSYIIGMFLVFIISLASVIGASYMVYNENYIIFKKKYARNHFRKLAWVIFALAISFAEVKVLCDVFSICGFINKLAFALHIAIINAVCMLHMENRGTRDILVNALSCFIGYFAFEWIYEKKIIYFSLLV